LLSRFLLLRAWAYRMAKFQVLLKPPRFATGSRIENRGATSSESRPLKSGEAVNASAAFRLIKS